MGLVNQRKAAGEWVAGDRQLWARTPFQNTVSNTKVNQKYRKKSGGCYACPYQCHTVFDLPGVGRGAQMCNDNWYRYSSGNEKMGESIEGMLEGNLLSQKLGLNNFELVGAMLFFYRTIKETGLLTERDFGLSSIPAMGRRKEPEFGSPEVHHQFLTEFLGGIADGTSPLSQGIARAAEQFGPEALELARAILPAWGHRAHHIRGVAEALHWATDTRDPFNSCHDYTNGFGIHKEVADWFGVPGGYLEGEGEGKHRNIYEDTEKLTIWVQNAQSLKNSLHICEFASSPELFFHPPEMDLRIFESQVLSAVTGIDVDADELWRIGDRIWNLRRAVMVQREDRHKDDDEIYEGMFREVFRVQSPELMVEPLDRERWKLLKDRYYELRGWNVDTGRPTRAKLEELGMKGVADKLQSAGKLG
jgi:aldehyde:ferredoxin oxidoreductase